MVDLPIGTVTFLFTDIVGSTQLLHELGPGYDAVFTTHRQLLRAAFEAHHGHEVDTQGDAFFVAFERAFDALACAVAAQRAFAGYPWPNGHAIEVRMGLHIGEPRVVEGHYIGLDVHRAARVAAAGHGGQIVLSEAMHQVVADTLPLGASLRDQGRHRMKDLPQPEHLYDVLIDGLRQDFPPLKTLEARPHNLPIPPTPLIGREKELTAIEGLMRRETVRLVTLIGPGGTGKTRLSLQVAMDILEDFHDGVYFVDLAPISDPELVAPTIAQALGVRDQGNRPLLDVLKDYLREKHLLLLLDNFEQVIPAATVVSDLLSTSRKLKVLVTSREVLHLRGEHDYAVPPLAVPTGRPLPPLERLTQYEAVRLFIERAQAVKGDFEVTSENAPAVAEICYRLDGLPLAIELAAARIRLLPPEAMLKRLDSRLKLLTGGGRDAHDRQRTLRGTIEWSYDLLNEEEQRLFRRLGVFVGGWTLEAAEAVAQDRLNVEGWTVDEGSLARTVEGESFAVEDGGLDVLEGLGSLVDKSLVQQREGVEGEPRFTMLETIREYALEQLQKDREMLDVQARHVDFFMALAEQAEPILMSGARATALAQLNTEHDNIRFDLAWAVEHREASIGLRMAGALCWFWYFAGYWNEGRAWLRRVLSLPDTSISSARARALRAAGLLAFYQEEYGVGQSLLEQSARLGREVRDLPIVAYALIHLAIATRLLGEQEKAILQLDESIQLFERVNDPWGLALSTMYRGIAAILNGDLGGRSFLKMSDAMFRELGDVWGYSGSPYYLAYAARQEHDDEGAHYFYGQAAALADEAGDKWRGALSRLALAAMAWESGDYSSAMALFQQSAPIMQELGQKRTLIIWLIRWARVALDQGHLERAVCLLSAAAALPAVEFTSLDVSEEALYDSVITGARRQLDPTSFALAWARGEAMTLDEALAYVLEGSADEATA